MKKFLNIKNILSLIFIIMSLYFILLQPVSSAVVYSAIDDGMYYPKIALNFVSTGTFTYDGVTLTNGFHPLWQILLIPVFYLFSEPISGLKASFTIIFITLLISLFFFFKISKRLSLSVPAVILSFYIVYANLRSFTLLYSMLESHLLLLVYMIYIYAALKYGDARFTAPGSAFLFGLLLSVAFITRIDSFLLILTYFLFQLIIIYKTKNYKPLLWSSAGTAVFIIPYLIINLKYFCHLSTVSSWTKFTLPSFQSLQTPLNSLTGLLLPRISYVLGVSDKILIITIVFIFLISLILFYIRHKKNKQGKTVLRNYTLKKLVGTCPEFFLFTIIHFTFVWLFVPYEAMFSVWYYVSLIIALGLFAGFFFSRVQNKLIIYPVIIIIGFLVTLQFADRDSFLQKKRMSLAKIEMADYIRENISKEARIGMTDSGITAFFADHNFTALNGLIGDFEMAALVKEGKLNQLTEKYSVNYFVWDMRNEDLTNSHIEIIYKTRTVTPFNNFSEGEKPMVLFRLKDIGLESWIKNRYK